MKYFMYYWSLVCLALLSCSSIVAQDMKRHYIYNFSIDLPASWQRLEAERGELVTFGHADLARMSMQRFAVMTLLYTEDDEDLWERTFGDIAHSAPPDSIITHSGPDDLTVGDLDALHYGTTVQSEFENDGEMIAIRMAGDMVAITSMNPENTRVALLFMSVNTAENWTETIDAIVQSYKSDDQPFAMTGRFGSAGEGKGQFKRPEAIATDSSGTLYTLDDIPDVTYGARIVVHAPDGTWIQDILLGEKTDTQHDPCKLFMAYGLAIDSATNFYIAHGSSHDGGVNKYALDGTCLQTWKRQGDHAIQVKNDGNNTIYARYWNGNSAIVRLSDNGFVEQEWPLELEVADWAISPDGNLVVIDAAEENVHIIGSDGQSARSWDIYGTEGEKPSEKHMLLDWEPSRLTIDAQNQIYVIDGEQDAVQVFDSTGRHLMQLGPEFPADTMKITRVVWELYRPKYLCLDHQGNLFVFDNGSYTAPKQIWKFTPEGNENTAQLAPVVVAAPQPKALTPEKRKDLLSVENDFWKIVQRVKRHNSLDVQSDVNHGIELANELLFYRPDDAAIKKGKTILQEAAP